MNDIQDNKFSMYNSVQLTLDDTTDQWNTIPIISSLKTQFDDLLLGIRETDSEREGIESGLGREKQTLKRQIAEKASMITGALHAYAAINGEEALAEETDITLSDIYRLRDSDLAGKVNMIADRCTNNITALADYGITNDTLTDLQTSLDDYNFLLGQPRAMQSKSAAATKDLVALFEQGDSLLKNKLDLVMRQFKFRNPNFYNRYRSARVIVDN